MNWEKINYLIEERLPEFKTLLVVSSILIGAFAGIDGFLSQFFNASIKAAFYLFVLISWIVYWGFNRFRLPRNKKGKVGIVIAIYSENEKERKRLKSDFIVKLKSDMRNEGILAFSQIIFLKNHFAAQITEANDPKRKIEKINKKIKAHFYVWGDIKKRPDGEEGDKYFINFQGYVAHKPIPNELSQEISKDFSKVLPREINFLEKRAFRGFAASARFVHLAAKYIIGLAAFVSQDPRLALRLHNGLKEQFNSFRPLPPHLQDIRNRIPLLISDETLWIARWHFENNKLKDTKEFLKRSLAENNNNYGSWLLKSNIDFLADHDPNEALKSTIKAEKYAKGSYEWRYNKAFLYFWLENYEKALKLCQKIKNQSYPTEAITLNEVRQFNLKLLGDPSPRSQLYFWLGFLSLFKEENLGNALQDFENFEKTADSKMNALKQKATAYLQDIKRKMELKE